MSGKVRTIKTALKADMKRLHETGVERALTSGRWQVLQKLAFLSANKHGGCFATKKGLERAIGIGKRSLYYKLDFLRDNGLVKVGTAPHPVTGEDCSWHFVDFDACAAFAVDHQSRLEEERRARAARAKKGRRTAAERRREDLKAEVLAELAAEVEELRSETERLRAERDSARLQREREEVLRDALRSEAESVKQERDQLLAEREQEERRLEELHAEREREERDLSRLSSSQIMDRFKGSVNGKERREILKWAYNQTVSAERRANGNFDPAPLITEYGSLGGALQRLLAARADPAITVN